MPREFKYDITHLISLIRDRPCLWDRTLENYKDRLERRTSWEEIFHHLDEQYEDMTPEAKKVFGEQVMVKWTNLRDTFVRSLKTKMGKPKRKYIYYSCLKFLLKVISEEENELDGSVTYFKQEGESEEEVPYVGKKRKTLQYNNDDYEASKGEASSSMQYDSQSNDIDFVQVEEQVMNDPRVMNEDEAFFASLLPTVVKYNEDQRLEFRIEVLAVMKKIKDQKKWND